MKILFCLFLCLFNFLVLSSIDNLNHLYRMPGDTVYITGDTKFGNFLDKVTSTQVYQRTYIGIPLIVGGMIAKKHDDHFRSLRNDYLPRFSRHADDYLQYAPAVAMLGMKSFGVESKSSWSRMLVTDAFSVLLMSGIVNGLKYTTHVTRPDGSNNHSFPSGHTATSFMTATMFANEYGYRNSWYSVGAYSVASITALMRMANNKHWLSDVLTGAGIGIMSTEVAYFLGDLLFKEKGSKRVVDHYIFEKDNHPSFIGYYFGLNIPLSGYDVDPETSFSTSSGCAVGLEGAYFFNPYVGIGGRATVSNTEIIANEEIAERNTFDVMSLSSGAYFSYPISARWLAGSKLLMGYVHYPQYELTEQIVPKNDGFLLGSGVSLTFKSAHHYGMRFFLDYNLLPPPSRKIGEYINSLICGASLVITFK